MMAGRWGEDALRAEIAREISATPSASRSRRGVGGEGFEPPTNSV